MSGALSTHLSAAPVRVGRADGLKGFDVTNPHAGVPGLPMVPTPRPSQGCCPSRGPRAFERNDLPSESQPPRAVRMPHPATPAPQTLGEWRGSPGRGPAALTRSRQATKRLTGWRAPTHPHSSPCQTGSHRPSHRGSGRDPNPFRASGAPLPTFARPSGLCLAGQHFEIIMGGSTFSLPFPLSSPPPE